MEKKQNGCQGASQQKENKPFQEHFYLTYGSISSMSHLQKKPDLRLKKTVPQLVFLREIVSFGWEAGETCHSKDFLSVHREKHQGKCCFKRTLCPFSSDISIKKGSGQNNISFLFCSIKMQFEHCFIDFKAGESCNLSDNNISPSFPLCSAAIFNSCLRALRMLAVMFTWQLCCPKLI